MKKLVIYGLLCLTTVAFAQEKPSRCPTVAELKNAINPRVERIKHEGPRGNYVGSHLEVRFNGNEYNTGTTWNFVIRDIGDDEDTALEKALSILNNLSFVKGPAQPWAANYFLCFYTDSQNHHAYTETQFFRQD